MSSGGAKTAGGFDVLAALPPLRWLALQRWFPPGLAVVMLLFLVALLGAGIAGTPVGNRNALVVFVWILWWFLLIALLLPLASRAWCAACPIPFFGDWLQRRTLLGVRVRGAADAGGPGVVIGHNRYFGFARRWPQALSNLWPQSAGFLLLATFSAVLLTNPLATPELAAQVNFNPFLIDRARACRDDGGRQPNFVTVDFCDVGDVFDAVATLNAVPWHPRDDELRLDQIQVRGTHNSYHVAPDPLPPTMATNSPRPTSKLMSKSTGVATSAL